MPGKVKRRLTRLDKLIFDRGLAPSRTAAQQYINEGRITVNGTITDKTAAQVPLDADVTVDIPEKMWVSRGAYKLIKALEYFEVEPRDLTCVDIGASTGGFTDVLLANNAAKVYAVDVGYGQLAWKLRSDSRVIVLERKNARYLKLEDIGGTKADLIVCDASFISLRLLLGVFASLLKESGRVICLVKPQFEVGKEHIGKGVVTNPELHAKVIDDISSFVDDETELTVIDKTFSPIRGPEGNIEFLFFLGFRTSVKEIKTVDTQELVREAHAATAHNTPTAGQGEAK